MSEVLHGGAEGLELDALAVFSHPDDAELTSAGTLLRLKSLGRLTGVLDMTRGEMGTRGTRLDVRLNLEQPDGHVFVTDEARTALVRVIRAYKPKVILTAHWDDPHPDHAATARLAREAARLASMRRYDEAAGQPAVQMPALAHAVYSRLVPPSFIVDISDHAEDKLRAILAHRSQFYDPDSREPTTRISEEGFLKQLESRWRYAGSLINVAAGEAYYVREALNVHDPVELLTRPMNIYS